MDDTANGLSPAGRRSERGHPTTSTDRPPGACSQPLRVKPVMLPVGSRCRCSAVAAPACTRLCLACLRPACGSVIHLPPSTRQRASLRRRERTAAGRIPAQASYRSWAASLPAAWIFPGACGPQRDSGVQRLQGPDHGKELMLDNSPVKL